MKHKRMIAPEKKRKIPAHFSWIDHKLVRKGYARKCSAQSLGLYLFLLSVSDSEGLSFYGAKSISLEINVAPSELETLRRELVNAELIAYSNGIYQVLDLSVSQPAKPERATYDGSKKVSEILKEMFAKEGK
jgi:hypothetical protein